jgi:hypothetical protein
VTARASFVTAAAVSLLSRPVTTEPRVRSDNVLMTNFPARRAELDRLIATGAETEVDALLSAMHTQFHDRPGDHVRVHLAWMRVHFRRRAYLRGLGHAFAGLVVAGPASLVQRHTGLVVPAFDAERSS